MITVVLLLLAGCGTGSGGSAPQSGRPSSPMPTAVPAAPGEVRTRGVVTVLDDGRPELCLGPVAESWPPQCSGPPVLGWDWKQERLRLGQPGEAPGQQHERAGAVRWGQYALTGRWDGTAFTVTASVPAALYEESAEPTPGPTADSPASSRPSAELEAIARRLGRRLPGALASYVENGRVTVDVIYDDGSLQAWAEEEYGAGTVTVRSMLLDVTDG